MRRLPSTWIKGAPVALLALGCGPASLETSAVAEVTGAHESALYGGVLDDDDHATDAVVALRVGDGSPFELCTGALIASNVVLTARHCISRNVTDEIDCDERGVSKNGQQVGSDVSPRTIHVLLGARPDFNTVSAANGKLIFRPTGQTICNTDVALVVLDKPITSVTPLRVRLSATVKTGESLRSVGYGQNDQKVRLGTRFRKEGVKVMGSGPVPRGPGGRPAIASAEFEVGRSICQGDSGGPAISETTGAVIGVVSRGVDCNLDFGHLYTKTSGFRTLFDTAFAEAGGGPLEEMEGLELASAAGASGGGIRPASESAEAVPSMPRTASAASGCAAAAAASGTSNGVLAPLLALAFAAIGRRRNRAAAVAPDAGRG